MSILDTINAINHARNVPATAGSGASTPAATGIGSMNQSLQTIAASLGGNRLSDAASWIGHSMLVTSDIATPLRDGSYAGQFTLTDPADQVAVNFVDGNGAVVHSETLGAQAAGDMSFAWDGKNEAGETVANGPLRLVVTATHNGQSSNAATATWTAIGGIQSPSSGGESRLVTGLGLLEPSAAIRLA